MKKAIITESEYLKSFSSEHGTFYSHKISLDNGDYGQINAKEESPAFLNEGETLYYDITPNGKYDPKIKRVSDKKQIEQYDKANGETKPQNNAGNQELTKKISDLSNEVEKLKETIKSLVKNNNLIYKAEPVKPDDDLPF